MDTLLLDRRKCFDSPPIESGEVHLWWLPLDVSAALIEKFQLVLSDRQREKMDRLPDKKKQRHYIAGRGYLHQLLEHYLPKEASLELTLGEQGKPALKDKSLDLHFNFTDTCGYGLFALSTDSELGLDVENTFREGDFERIIQRRFAFPEQDYLRSIPRQQQNEYFLRCWTRKEAFGKLLGCGLNYTLRDHIMCLNLSQSEFEYQSAGGNRQVPEKKMWQGQQFVIEQDQDRYVACLFSEGIKHKELSAFTLVEDQ